MAAPVLQFKRGAFSNLPALKSGEPGFTTDKYDFYIGLDNNSTNNKFFGSHRYWTRETASTGSGINLVENSSGTDYITLRAPSSVGAAVTFIFPGVQGSSGTVLTNDGNGNLSWGSGFTNAIFSGITTISDTTDSISKDTGSLVIEGGVGIEKSVHIGAALSVTSNLYIGGQSEFIGIVTFRGGTINLGDSGTDDIVIGGEFASDLIPTTDNTYSLGSLSKQWKDIYINGTADIDALTVSGISTFDSAIFAGNGISVAGFSTIYQLNVTNNLNVGGVLDVDTAIDIGGNSLFAGITSFTNSTESTTIDNGAIVIDGGVGIQKNVNIGGSLNVSGNVTIGGTFVAFRGQDVFIENKDFILGYTTSIIPNDDTANHAGVAIASTIGSPLTSFSASGINTLPDTYKQLMWFKNGTLGFSTDAFAFNYALAIGTTSMANGVVLAVGSGVTASNDSISASNGYFNNINFTGTLNQNGSPFVASRWTAGTGDNIYRLNGNVGVGTTNPQTKLQVGGVLGFGPDKNIRIGDNTTGANLTPNNPFPGAGTLNNFIGVGAGNSTTSGYVNNFIGHVAGYYNTTGNDNNFFGRNAGFYNTTGYNNNFFGHDAGQYNTTGNSNNFLGNRAGYKNTTANYNIFLGQEAGYFNTTGSNNTFVGKWAGYYHTTGEYNTAFGVQAGNYNISGSNNNFFGRYTGIHTNTSYRVVIGQGQSANVAFDVPKNADKQFAVGINSTGTTEYWLVGNENFNIGIGVTNPTSKLTVGGDVSITGVITATTFVGAVTGTASTATTVDTTATSINADYYVTFVDTFAGQNGETLRVGAGLSVNPSNGEVKTTGDITIGGNDIKASDGTTAITLTATTGAVGVSSDLTVSGSLFVRGTTTEVNTETLKVEDSLIEVGLVNSGGSLVPPSSDLNIDVGVLFHYYTSSAKKAGVYWDDSASRVVISSDLSESSSVITSSTYAALEIGSLWVTDCAGTSQVINCAGGVRTLENITVDGGSF